MKTFNVRYSLQGIAMRADIVTDDAIQVLLVQADRLLLFAKCRGEAGMDQQSRRMRFRR